MDARLSIALRRCGAVLAMPPLLSGAAMAHPGGLNAEGCHNNRKTGEYHCHRAAVVERTTQAAAAPAQPASNVPRSATVPTCYTGPRGGTYTITKSGKKNYNGC